MSITAANAVIILNLPGVFQSPFQLQQFTADNIYGVDEIEAAEVQMGVDGNLTGGFVNVPTPQTFYLMADSPAAFFFEQWYQQQKAVQDTFIATGTVTLKSTGKKYSMVRGFLTRYKPIVDAQKVLREYRHVVTWQSAIPNPVLPTG